MGGDNECAFPVVVFRGFLLNDGEIVLHLAHKKPLADIPVGVSVAVFAALKLVQRAQQFLAALDAPLRSEKFLQFLLSLLEIGGPQERHQPRIRISILGIKNGTECESMRLN